MQIKNGIVSGTLRVLGKLKAKSVEADSITGPLTGNASTATKFASSQSVALTGDVTGSASSQAGWSVATTLANSGVTAGSYGPSANASPAHSGTFSVPYLTVDSKGRVTAASTKTITLPSDNNSDTKNTAGSTDTSSKIFLIGATSQAANPATYSHDTAYVGTDGCLYSGGTKVSVSGHTHTKSQITDFPSSLPASDVYAWAKASTKPSYAWDEITGKPSSFTPASHTHHYLSTIGDRRDVSTTPNTYTNTLIFQGLKTNSTIGSPSGDDYSYLIGLRGWSDKSGGNAHELAFNNSGIYVRQGATTSWNAWEKVLTSSNYTSYAPTKTGSGASGTWGISITGSAGSVAWNNVTEKPDVFKSFWTNSPGFDCNSYFSSEASSFTTFTYNNNAPFAGPVAHFGAGGYGFYLGTAYYEDSTLYYKRHGGSNDGGMGDWRVLLSDINYTSYVGNGTVTITQNGVNKGSFTLNQSGNATIALTDTNTTYSAATTSAAGLMSAADKTKLNGIATGANAYSLPTASSSTLGGVKTTSTVTSTSGLTACPIISGVPYYKDTNTTYSVATTSANGLMSAADKTKLNSFVTVPNMTLDTVYATNEKYNGSTVYAFVTEVAAVNSSGSTEKTIAAGRTVSEVISFQATLYNDMQFFTGVSVLGLQYLQGVMGFKDIDLYLYNNTFTVTLSHDGSTVGMGTRVLVKFI